MNCVQRKNRQTNQLDLLVKLGLIRELYRQHHITQAQFEQLMRLQRI